MIVIYTPKWITAYDRNAFKIHKSTTTCGPLIAHILVNLPLLPLGYHHKQSYIGVQAFIRVAEFNCINQFTKAE